MNNPSILAPIALSITSQITIITTTIKEPPPQSNIKLFPQLDKISENHNKIPIAMSMSLETVPATAKPKIFTSINIKPIPQAEPKLSKKIKPIEAIHPIPQKIQLATAM